MPSESAESAEAMNRRESDSQTLISRAQQADQLHAEARSDSGPDWPLSRAPMLRQMSYQKRKEAREVLGT